MAVMTILRPHMSQRNLADVLVLFTKGDYGIIINDVYGTDSRVVNPDLLERVEGRLRDCGFGEWIDRVN